MFSPVMMTKPGDGCTAYEEYVHLVGRYRDNPRKLQRLKREQDSLGGFMLWEKEGTPSLWDTPPTPQPPTGTGHTIWVKAMVGPLWSSKRSMVLRLSIMCSPYVKMKSMKRVVSSPIQMPGVKNPAQSLA